MRDLAPITIGRPLRRSLRALDPNPDIDPDLDPNLDLAIISVSQSIAGYSFLIICRHETVTED